MVKIGGSKLQSNRNCFTNNCKKKKKYQWCFCWQLISFHYQWLLKELSWDITTSEPLKEEHDNKSV
jgi:hypothetical protein